MAAEALRSPRRIPKEVAVSDFIDIVFDGPPSHESGRFVEVEDAQGKSIKFGEWVKRDDGYWALRINHDESKQREQAVVEAERERCVKILADENATYDGTAAVDATANRIFSWCMKAIRSIDSTPALDKLLAKARDKALETAAERLRIRAEQWAHGENPNATPTSMDIHGELVNAAVEIDLLRAKD
jgi:hypothetical protein